MSASPEPTGLVPFVVGGPAWWGRQSFAAGMRRRGLYERRYDRYERDLMPGGRPSWAFVGRMMAFGLIVVLLPCALLGGAVALLGQQVGSRSLDWLGTTIALWGIVTLVLPWLGWLVAPNAGPKATTYRFAQRMSLGSLLLAAVLALAVLATSA